MNEQARPRLASNEDVFRRVNEGIVRGRWPGESDAPIGFRCECARLGCNVLLALTLPEYKRVRANPRRFVLVPGHELLEAERVVEQRDQYVIVEKIGGAGERAQELDPRT